jgi:hypothetical protein
MRRMDVADQGSFRDALTEQYNLSPRDVFEYNLLEVREEYLRMACELRSAGWNHPQVLEVMKIGKVAEACKAQADTASLHLHPITIISCLRTAQAFSIPMYMDLEAMYRALGVIE